MSKFSLSIVAVYALILGAGTAFTIVVPSKSTPGYGIYANTNNSTYLPTGCNDPNFQQGDIPVSPLNYTQVHSQVLYSKAQLDTFSASHCAGAAVQVCFVILNLMDGVPDPAFATKPVASGSGISACVIYFGTYF